MLINCRQNYDKICWYIMRTDWRQKPSRIYSSCLISAAIYRQIIYRHCPHAQILFSFLHPIGLHSSACCAQYIMSVNIQSTYNPCVILYRQTGNVYMTLSQHSKFQRVSTCTHSLCTFLPVHFACWNFNCTLWQHHVNIRCIRDVRKSIKYFVSEFYIIRVLYQNESKCIISTHRYID